MTILRAIEKRWMLATGMLVLGVALALACGDFSSGSSGDDNSGSDGPQPVVIGGGGGGSQLPDDSDNNGGDDNAGDDGSDDGGSVVTPGDDDDDDADDGGDDGSEGPQPTSSPGVPVLSCAVDADCDNGVFCDGVERCRMNNCAAGDEIPCDNIFEQCDEATDSCIPADQLCNDNFDCADGESCDRATGQCVPDDSSVCGPGAGNCYIANFTMGCEDVSCCEAVCLRDFECCTLAWDSDCASLALSFCPQ